MKVSKLSTRAFALGIFLFAASGCQESNSGRTSSGQNGDMGTGDHEADMSISTRGDLDSSLQAGSDSRLTDGTAPTDLGMPPNQRRDGWMLTDSDRLS